MSNKKGCTFQHIPSQTSIATNVLLQAVSFGQLRVSQRHIRYLFCLMSLFTFDPSAAESNRSCHVAITQNIFTSWRGCNSAAVVGQLFCCGKFVQLVPVTVAVAAEVRVKVKVIVSGRLPFA